MNFDFSEEQKALHSEVSGFARRYLNDRVAERDETGEFARDKWKACAEFGIHGMHLPVEFGGTDADIVTTCVAMEALGLACHDHGLLFSIHAHMWAVQSPILAFGTEQQKRRFLPKLCDGSWIGAHGISEPDTGSDAFALRTRAEKQDDFYILNGSKTFVTNAPVADLLLIFATVNRDRGMWGVTGFLVEKDAPGMTISNPISKMGLRTSPMGEVAFNDCKVPVENRLGTEGQGASIFNHSMGWERACILATDVGAMIQQFEACREYAKTRQQFGKPIGNFQLIAAKLADMRVRQETARLLLYRAAAALADGSKDAAMYGTMAKLHISEAAVQTSLEAIRIHGGYGYMKEFGIERGLRNAIGGQLYSGTSEIQRILLSRHLGLCP
jgi:alkylation response protein AidB-like acyl-CoA dehydrogenase